MKIAVGSDHRGIQLKKSVMAIIREDGHEVKDFGTDTEEPVDYPDVARDVGQAVGRVDFEQGILICSTGIGMCIAANKVKGIRAALCYDAFCATRAREHNDANVLCLNERMTPEEAKEIISAFLTTRFEGGRHQRRVDKIKAMEAP